MVSTFGEANVATGLNATADSFYSSQGRKDPNFNDANDHLIQEIIATYPNAVTLEMETFTLFHLSQCTSSQTVSSVPQNLDSECQNTKVIKSAATTMIFADRTGGGFITPSLVAHLEWEGGKACLQALIDTEL
jgi:uridine phosphorylase